MDFVGIGINDRQFDEELQKVLRDNCYPNLYLKLTKGSRMDPEIGKGVNHLSKHKDMEIVQYELEEETVFTSNNLSQDLTKPFRDEGESLFLKYLEQIQIYLPNKYYLIFGFEWYEADRVRFISLKGNDLKNYFSKNNGWNLMLYSIENDVFYPDLDVPLIIEVDNNQEA